MQQHQSARTVSDVLGEIRQTSETEYQKGYLFEELFMRVARRDPELELAGIWRWSEWPEREALTSQDGRDPGIDLVAQHASGAWIAIQCKCYAESHRVEKKDINAFLAYSQGEPFALRWFVATCPWGRYAETAVRGPNPLARRIDFVHRYGDQPYKDPAREEITPWPRQAEAIHRCTAGLQDHDRGRLVMACGTGKDIHGPANCRERSCRRRVDPLPGAHDRSGFPGPGRMAPAHQAGVGCRCGLFRRHCGQGQRGHAAQRAGLSRNDPSRQDR